MRMKIVSLIVAGLAAFAAPAAEAAITYSGSVTGTNSTTASYTITTDGTLGTLSAANFVSYSLSINGYSGYNNSGSGVLSGYYDGLGNASATATALSFNFSGSNYSPLVFYNGDAYLCFTTVGLSCLGEPVPSVAFGSFSIGQGGVSALRSGTQVIATANAVPEPATWAMMLVGFGMVGFGLRSRRKQTVRVTYA